MIFDNCIYITLYAVNYYFNYVAILLNKSEDVNMELSDKKYYLNFIFKLTISEFNPLLRL